jgi:hypothetical protein
MDQLQCGSRTGTSNQIAATLRSMALACPCHVYIWKKKLRRSCGWGQGSLQISDDQQQICKVVFLRQCPTKFHFAVPFVFRHAMRISLVLVNFPGREMVVVLKCASGKKFSILDQHNDSSGRDVIRHMNGVIDLSSNPCPRKPLSAT